VAPVERTVAGVFRYELVAEDGEPIGDLATEEGSWTIGDLVPAPVTSSRSAPIENSTCKSVV
jgi:hypothetical protein